MNKMLKNRLINKSIEAFIMGLEIYNKPTIRYRIEGFSFFICNAWELMLKAELLNRKQEIYYRDNPERTISLNETVQKIYSDKNTRLRINLEKIIELRNISTHFITEDYEAKYAPLFQACVINYTEELLKFHDEDITNHIAQNFLTITAEKEFLTNEQIKLKYPPEIAEKLMKQSNEIDVLTKELNSSNFAINIAQHLYISKKKGDADFTIKMDQHSNNPAAIIKELKDPSDTHKYSYKNVVVAVNERLKKKHITMNYDKGFNKYVLKLFIDFYDIKNDPKYAYKHKIGNHSHFTYSQQLIEFIVKEIERNPDKVVKSLKK